MSALRTLTSGLRTLFRKDEVERELDDEVGHYVEMATQAHMRAGLSRVAAERAARVDLGGVEVTKENVRSSGWDAAVETVLRDIRYAARGLARNPGFTAVVVLTLALGIGVNTVMFSVVNAVMLRPLPYRDAGRLALVWTDDTRRGLHEEATAYGTISDWRSDNRSFEDIAFYSAGRATLTGSRGRERSRNAFVSGNLFSVLGVLPSQGRVISIADERNAERVVVISHSLWQRRFGGDSSVIGKTLEIEENESKDGSATMRIIGVMPAGFYFPDKQTELWTTATTYWRFRREAIERFAPWARRWTAVGRLKPGVAIGDARADLGRVGERLSVAYKSNVPDFPGFTPNVVPIFDHVAGKNTQSALWVLLGAVGFVLLVACANVANLLLARGATRQQEFAIRRALGAARSRLVRQLLVESLLLASIGGVLGIALAMFGTRALAVAAANRVPRIEEISIDATVLVFAALVSVVAGIVFGVAPAFRVSRTDASETLKSGRQAGGGVQTRRTRGLLIIAECALAVVLLTGAGLLLRSLEQVRSIAPGFDPTGVLTVRVEFPLEAPPTAEERTRTSLIEPARARGREQMLHDLLARIEAIPGVEAVGFTDDMFITGNGNKSITIPGRSTDSLGAGELNDGSVTPALFSAIRVPLRRGRYLTRGDAQTKLLALWSPVITDLSLAEKERRATPEPVVVNEAFVRRFFAGEDPIGKRFCIDPTNKTYWYVIVGVVGDMHRQGLEKTMIPEYFGSYIPSPNGRADLIVRTQRDPLSVAPTVRGVLRATVPNILISGVSTADRQLGDMSAERDFQTWMLATFAALALGLAGVGIYGVVHYSVAERTSEIGVRVAFGASPSDVIRLMITQGMRTPCVGIALGLGAAFGLTRLMSHLLFGVNAADPATFASVTFVLVGVALVACYIPARRAKNVDPMTALRRE
jgi:putative ABC transport system permease protein